MTFDVAAALLSQPTSKKKRRYVLLLGAKSSVNDQDLRTMEKSCGSALTEHTTLRLEDPDEALRAVVVKNVELIVLDPSFLRSTELSVDFALEVKRRKPCPIVFLTREENKLVELYRQKVNLYAEMDDYLAKPVDPLEAQSRLRRIASIEGRAAKRVSLGTPAEVYCLNSGRTLRATLADLSLVGFGLTLEEQQVIRTGEQVRVSLNLAQCGIFHPFYGDQLRLAGRVRRISLDGTRVGASTEHLTAMQHDCLVRVLEVFLRRQRAQRKGSKKLVPVGV